MSPTCGPFRGRPASRRRRSRIPGAASAAVRRRPAASAWLRRGRRSPAASVRPGTATCLCHEMLLDRVRQGPEQAAVVPRAAVEIRRRGCGFRPSAGRRRSSGRCCTDAEDRSLQAVLVSMRIARGGSRIISRRGILRAADFGRHGRLGQRERPAAVVGGLPQRVAGQELDARDAGLAALAPSTSDCSTSRP